MQCSRCQHENPSGTRFCGQCAAPLAAVCAACGAENAPGNRFCGQCAAPLSQVASTPTFAGPETYTPKHLADKILTLRSSIEGERKQVTVLFCDIANSTPLAERLGAEAMHGLLNRFFTLSLAEVHRYEGTVNQFLGDGFMALFGAPIAHEDHAQRAVLAAAAIRRVVSGREGALSLRMGLNTGEVVVGSIGDGLRMDYTAIGDTTNLAARLQQAGAPGSILLGEATWRMVRDLVRVEGLRPVEVKGKAKPVSAYRLVAIGPTRAPIAARVERPLSHFVGRERELATLRDLLIQAERGHGQLVGLVGEPGVGKSRLLYEFGQGLAGRTVTYLGGRCLSWGRTVPYLPILEIVRASCGVADADTPEAVAGKVRAALHEVGMDVAEAAPYVLHLLGVKEGTERLEVLSAHALKERTFETLRQMVVGGSRIRPLILGVEDLHWIDATSEEYLGALAEGLAGLPILVVVTYRPGYRMAWIDKSYATQIALRPLSPEDGLAVVRSVLGEAPAAEPVARAILDKAEGNPFFIEELSRALLDHPELGQVQAIPATVQDVLMARIDRLPEDAKRLLQTAAVLGREVPARLLAAVWGDALALGPALSELRRLEFLYELSGSVEPVHVFKHGLIQEVAYESLLASRRQALHAAAGRALESMYAERLDDAYDRLAYHYARGSDPEKAVLYLSLVATRAARNYANVEAASTFRQAREHAEHLPESAREPQVFEMLLREGKALFFLGRRREVVELVLGFEDRVNRFADPLWVARFYWTLSVNWGYLGDRERARASLMRAVTAAREAGDDQSLGGCIIMAAAERLYAGRARECVELGRQAVAHLERAADTEFLANAHAIQGLAHLMLGEVGPAREALESASRDRRDHRRRRASGATQPGCSVSSRPWPAISGRPSRGAGRPSNWRLGRTSGRCRSAGWATPTWSAATGRRRSPCWRRRTGWPPRPSPGTRRRSSRPTSPTRITPSAGSTPPRPSPARRRRSHAMWATRSSSPRPSAPPAASPWREGQLRRRGPASRRRSGLSLRSRCGSRSRAPTSTSPRRPTPGPTWSPARRAFARRTRCSPRSASRARSRGRPSARRRSASHSPHGRADPRGGRRKRLRGLSRWVLLRREPAVDREDGARHPRRLIRRQVERAVRDVLRRAEAAERMRLREAALAILGVDQAGDHRGVDAAGTDRIHAHAAPRVGDGHGPREGDDAALGRAVGVRAVAAADQAGGRRDVDDRAAARGDQGRDPELAAEEHALEVHVDDPIPAVLGELGHEVVEAAAIDGGVVVEDVEGAIRAGSLRVLLIDFEADRHRAEPIAEMAMKKTDEGG